jgi:hypothetical protein
MYKIPEKIPKSHPKDSMLFLEFERLVSKLCLNFFLNTI